MQTTATKYPKTLEEFLEKHEGKWMSVGNGYDYTQGTFSVDFFVEYKEVLDDDGYFRGELEQKVGSDRTFEYFPENNSCKTIDGVLEIEDHPTDKWGNKAILDWGENERYDQGVEIVTPGCRCFGDNDIEQTSDHWCDLPDGVTASEMIEFISGENYDFIDEIGIKLMSGGQDNGVTFFTTNLPPDAPEWIALNKKCEEFYRNLKDGN